MEERQPYTRITKFQRKTLISYIVFFGLSVKQAAQIAEINYSTAKKVFQKYRKGTVSIMVMPPTLDFNSYDGLQSQLLDPICFLDTFQQGTVKQMRSTQEDLKSIWGDLKYHHRKLCKKFPRKFDNQDRKIEFPTSCENPDVKIEGHFNF